MTEIVGEGVSTEPLQGPSERGRWPTFLVIGAGRCGTTTVHGLLIQHPQVCVPPIKEPNYFAMRALNINYEKLNESSRIAWANSVSDPELYRALFVPTTPAQPAEVLECEEGTMCVGDTPMDSAVNPIAFGECSPVYLAVAGVAKLIREAIPDVRLIALLRDPVDRAISHHAHNLACGIDPEPDFERALIVDEAMGEHSNYLNPGRYAALLRPYAESFDRDQLLLIDYTAFAMDPSAVMEQIFEHIGVDPFPAIRTGFRALQTTPTEVPPAVRDRLAQRFHEDTTELIDRFGFEPARGWTSYRADPVSDRNQTRDPESESGA